MNSIINTFSIQLANITGTPYQLFYIELVDDVQVIKTLQNNDFSLLQNFEFVQMKSSIPIYKLAHKQI